jgi:hypothetical protein
MTDVNVNISQIIDDIINEFNETLLMLEAYDND